VGPAAALSCDRKRLGRSGGHILLPASQPRDRARRSRRTQRSRRNPAFAKDPAIAKKPFGLSLSKPLPAFAKEPAIAKKPFGLSLSKPPRAFAKKPAIAKKPFGLSLSKPLRAPRQALCERAFERAAEAKPPARRTGAFLRLSRRSGR